MTTFLRIRPTYAEVDLGALRQNLQLAQARSAPAELLAVVKANAYGHGAVPVARTLEAAGVAWLGVALVEEGVELREAGVKSRILVLGGAYDGGYEALVEHRLTPVVFRTEHLAGLALAARRTGKRVAAHLKLDTGMGRIGVLPDGLSAFLEEAERFPEVALEGLLSHFANADLANAELTVRQVSRFREALAQMRSRGTEPALRHLSNSAGVLSLPEVRDGVALNLVRPGLMLYGVSPAPSFIEPGQLRPVLSWRTAVTHVKQVPVGTPVSYGSTWTARRPSTIATLPVGYADGYSRRFSNQAQVLVRGQRAGVAGRVCMDMTLVDVTDIPGVAVGDEVVLLGSQGKETLTADALAEWEGTIPYEVLCGVGARVPRLLKGEG
jgi:alanine racemase